MRYGTLTDGKLVFAPNPLTVGLFNVHNPSGEIYAAAGYLPIVDTPYPQPDEPIDSEDLKYYVHSWEERGGRIVGVWTEAEPPVPDPVPPTLEERVSAVESYTATLGADLDLLLSGATEEELYE